MGTESICLDEKESPPEPTEDHGHAPADMAAAEALNAADVVQPQSDSETPDDDPVKKLKEALEVARKEAADNYDRLLRVSAEFDNYKKRNAREMCELRNYANESIIRDFLPVLDNLERALSSSSANGAQANNSILTGVEMTLKEILRIMEKHGVSRVEALEQPFNPAFHQAVMREETDACPENMVTQELQKGYRLHERLIRPAMVAVSAAMTKAPATEETFQNETE